LQRRDLLKTIAAVTAASATAPVLQALDAAIPVVDAHIHLFDPTRPGGVPWPQPSDTALFHPAMPERYERLSHSHGVVGAIAIECSSWLVDNFWLQDVVEKNPILLGFIGDLLPGAPDFAATLDRLHRSPLFLGIRYGNLWNRDLGADAKKPEFVHGLKELADAGLVLETANPDPALMAAVLAVADHVPTLRIVIDHLPHAEIPADAQARARYEADLRELSKRPQVFVKGSEIVRRVAGNVVLDVASYKAALDALWDLFGEDRMFFGSDWPNSDTVAPYDETFAVAQTYIATRSRQAQEKYFWKNSLAVYKWKPRAPAQTPLARYGSF
jgi:predicted TIM-barrel fold metal-dependent hydrolase